MARELRTLADLAVDQGSGVNTHIKWLTINYIVLGCLVPYFGLLWHMSSHGDTHHSNRHTHIHINIINKSFKEAV